MLVGGGRPPSRVRFRSSRPSSSKRWPSTRTLADVLLFYKILKVGVVTEPLAPGEPDVVEVAREVETKARRLLGRAVAIREVDAGSCNGCEIEITSLTGDRKSTRLNSSHVAI